MRGLPTPPETLSPPPQEALNARMRELLAARCAAADVQSLAEGGGQSRNARRQQVDGIKARVL